MRQEISAADFLRFFFEHIDEFAADEFAFLFGVGDARQSRHEALFCVHDDERDIIMVAEQGFDLFAFIHAQQAVVDKDASELRANCFVNEDRRNRTVDAARKPANDAA